MQEWPQARQQQELVEQPTDRRRVLEQEQVRVPVLAWYISTAGDNADSEWTTGPYDQNNRLEHGHATHPATTADGGKRDRFTRRASA